MFARAFLDRLPGTFNQEMAGKRMRLPTPETWETQVSLLGNVASTWEALLDHRKLPFMAMLRNLRNMILSNMSPKHHDMVIKKLMDQRSVISSRQFPFQFFSAYEVLAQLPTAEKGPPPAAASAGRGRGGKRGGRGGRGGGSKRGGLEGATVTG